MQKGVDQNENIDTCNELSHNCLTKPLKTLVHVN